MSFLDKESRCHCRLTCSVLKDAVDSPEVWENVCVELSNVKQYSRNMWETIRQRRLREVILATPSVHTQGVLGLVLRSCRTIRMITAHCSMFHAFYFTNKQMRLSPNDISLEEICVIMDNYHFSTYSCKCLTVLATLKKLNNITIILKTPTSGRHMTVEFYTDLKSRLPAIRKILLLHPPDPPAGLIRQFSGKLSEPRITQLAAEVQKALLGEVEVIARER